MAMQFDVLNEDAGIPVVLISIVMMTPRSYGSRR